MPDLVILSALTTTAFLAVLSTRRRSSPPVERGVGHSGSSVEHIHGRILFVHRRDDDALLLDCVAGLDHPARSGLAPGTPFALTVEPAGPSWFGEAVEGMVARWAEDDTLVEFLVVAGPDGRRVDVRGDRSRVRLEVRAHAGLG